MNKTSSKSKNASPTHKTTSKFKISSAHSSSTPKIIINIHKPASRRGEAEAGEEEEMVTYLFLTEEEEHKLERKLSDKISPKRSRSRKSGVFLTQDEGKRCLCVALSVAAAATGHCSNVRNSIEDNQLRVVPHVAILFNVCMVSVMFVSACW